jgi:hypothetical protein
VQLLASSEALTALGILGAWLLAFPIAPSPFSHVDLHFKFLVGGQLTEKSVQRDRRLFWRWVPPPAYWVSFILWYLLMTGGLFALLYMIARGHWAWANMRARYRANRREQEQRTTEPAIKLLISIQILGIVPVLLAVIGVIVQVID